MTRFLSLILSLAALSSLLSCSDDGEYNNEAFLSDIVTVESSGDEGSRFTFRRYDDSPLVTLTAPQLRVDDKYVGKRMLLRYYPESGKPYTDDIIRPIAISPVNCDTAVIRPVERYDWDADAVFLNSIWRSGNYINVHLRAVYSDKPRYFSLMVDSLTLTDAVPQVYLVHNTLGAPDSYMREVYASFDITNVWSRNGCDGIEIHVNDSNLKKDIYTFNK
ncbi:MAG: hypothetical protein DBY35_11935 [Bacteroidales bacterium]|nr:MAG: hypothetical protein DBY35_11935 [Bacteroidales bacterium]